MLKAISIKILSIIVVSASIYACQPTDKDKQTSQMKPDSLKHEPSDMATLLIGTYTTKLSHVDGKAAGIYIYQLNMKTGELTYVSTTDNITNPSYLTVHPNGRYVYAVSVVNNDSLPGGLVYAYTINKEQNSLTEINRVSSAGEGPCFVGVDPTGKYAVIANYGDGTVALLSIEKNGALKNVAFNKHEGKGLTSRQTSAHAHSIWARDNGEVYAVDLGIDQVKHYHLDSKNGKLIPTGKGAHVPPGSGPRHMSFHPTQDKAYVVSELSGTIDAFDIDTRGDLKSFQHISTLPPNAQGDAGSADIHITPNGKYLYASNRGDFNNIAMFSVDPDTGMLTSLGHQSTKGKGPRNFVIDPTGKYLLVANQDTGNVITLRIDNENGKLIDIGVESKIPTPVCLKFMPE